ncbi:MAG: hypothetical protein JWP94_53 [Mucilaginibacter sp.]|nr:hypothetical protein [Mucilaginibacter sp.]
MTGLKFGTKIFLRAAGKSYAKFNYGDLRSLLKTNLFQAAIFFSSVSLYDELKKKRFNYDDLPEKPKLAIKKYYNRYCFRSTPFGLFASVATANWQDEGAKIKIDPPAVNISADFQLLSAFVRNFNERLPFTGKLFKNQTIYKAGKEYRYIKSELIDHPTVSFELAAFPYSNALKKILDCCQNGIPRRCLEEFCTEYCEDPGKFVADLIDSGILLLETHPRFTDPEYFDNLNKIFNDGDSLASLPAWRAVSSIFNQNYPTNNFPLPVFASVNWPDFTQKVVNKFYVNSFSNCKGSVDKKYQSKLLEGLRCLDSLTVQKPIPALQKFKERFKDRYEGREISLLSLLDPETGIGYMGLESEIKTNPILENVDFKVSSKCDSKEWTAVHQFFLDKLIKGGSVDVITISDDDIKKLDSDKSSLFPPSISVSFHVYDDGLIHIQHAGGCSAAALAARFTQVNSDMFDYTTEIVNAEQVSNPGVIFAEVSCLVDDNVANINLRNKTYDYEIPILVPFDPDSQQIIQPDDLCVSIINDEVILRSKKINKRVIPRYSSAYNYNQHSLALFRFLCDLQHQSIKTDYTLDLKQMFPGLAFYPRVVYRSCLIHEAVWVLQKDAISKIRTSKNSVASCRDILFKLSIPSIFKTKIHDHSLVFNTDITEEVELFVHTLKDRDCIVIKEASFIETSYIKDTNNNPMANEMVAAVINREPTYREYPVAYKSQKASNVKRSYLPGDEWLYYKIYCIPEVADTLLATELYQLVILLTRKKLIQQWFFIRYNDPDPHLRLRLKTNADKGYEIMQAFNSTFHKKQQMRIILDTYNRELERYGPNTIGEIETVFFKSSLFAINYFQLAAKSQFRFSWFDVLLISVDEIINEYYKDLTQKEHFFKKLSDTMAIEFKADKKLNYQLNEKYRELKSVISTCLSDPGKNKVLKMLNYSHLSVALTAVKKKTAAQPAEETENLFRDIIHMHINRMVNKDQRKQEFIIYFLLYKHYRSSKFVPLSV